VSTDISNLGELRDLVHVATQPADFVSKIELALGIGKAPVFTRQAEETLSRNSWPERVKAILDLLDRERLAPESS
jgi:hypothetical protein